MKSKWRFLCLDMMQGNCEQRTEAYMKYAEGAPQQLTQQHAENGSRVSGSARK